MSSVESAAMSGSEVSEKGPVDFGVKAVSLKTQGEPNRLIQSGGPLRSVPSPNITRPSSGFSAQHPTIPVLGNIPQKSGLGRVTSSSGSGILPSGKPVSSSAIQQSSHPTTYLVPRGGSQPSGLGPRASPATGRQSGGTLQPVNAVQALVRTPSPIANQPSGPGWVTSPPMNNVRAASPGGGQPRVLPARTSATAASVKPVSQSRPIVEAPRPLLLHTAPTRPLATAQLHIAPEKMKVPVGSVTQVVPIRPQFGSATGFVAQSQPTTILQRTDGVALQNMAPAATMLAAPVRLAPSQPPLLATQRVAVSAASSRSGSQQHLSVASNLSNPRGPSQGNTGTRATGSATGPPGVSKIAVSSVATGAILATTGRLPYSSAQVVPGPTTVTRVPTPGTTVLSSSKPGVSGPTPLIVTTASRMPVPNHQVGKPPRFGPVRTQGPVTNQPLLTTALPSGLVVHPQLVVSTGKPQSLASNHVTSVRPPPTSASGSKVMHTPIQISASPVSTCKTAPTPLPVTSTQLTPVISKQPDMYKLAPTSSISNRPAAVVATQSVSPAASSAETAPSVYIPAAHRNITPSGIICSQPTLTERTTGAPTLSTYTLPGGASYFYEAPSGYQLATDAPLVARPLSTDAPLVSRELSTEGPLIARPFTPGLITSTQAMRFNPVMIVDPNIPAAPALSTVATSTSVTCDVTPLTSTENLGGSIPCSSSKITSSPRPSILRKRDSEALSTSKAVKNLSGALSSGSASRSRTPSPPTPPASLTLETNQTTNDHGPSSNGSTTISATSSPGPEDNLDPDRPPMEMSPRKKPRKQLLNDANDSIDMEFISEDKIKKENEIESAESEGKEVIVKRPANLSLLQSYRHSWKARNNHFQRYTDVKPKEERRPSVTELANQRNILQRVNGWKIYHLNSQFEDLFDIESSVLDRLSTICKAMDNDLRNNDLEKDIADVNELFMGNIQRSKVIKDQINEAKSQVMKVFDHKNHVSEIVLRCASKRNAKKRDKY